MKALNAANVMVAVRDHLANDVDGLCKVIGVSPYYGRYELESILREHSGDEDSACDSWGD